jgi:hypothetical protein
MTIQHVELRGERYVILPEREYLELQQRLHASSATRDAAPPPTVGRFRKVVPLKVGGVPASQMLIQDRR